MNVTNEDEDEEGDEDGDEDGEGKESGTLVGELFCFRVLTPLLPRSRCLPLHPYLDHLPPR